jgi:transposase
MLRPAIATTSIPERRARAATLFAEGLPQAEVARRCDVSRTTAMRWYRTWIKRGKKDLEPLPRGRPNRLTQAKLQRVEKELLRGAQAHGFSSELWTLERVAELIERVSGVRYHPGHVWRVLRALGWSLQKPTTRARERDELKIASWKKTEWPRLKKTP